MDIKPSKLERIAAGVSGVIVGTEYLLCYNNFDGFHASGAHVSDRFRWLPISESYFGDVPEIFATVLVAGFVGDQMKKYGIRKQNSVLEFCGKYFPEITATAVGAYYALGKTILPQLLPGTADSRDVPAVVITAIVSPIITNYVVKSWKTNWQERVKNLLSDHSTNASLL